MPARQSKRERPPLDTTHPKGADDLRRVRRGHRARLAFGVGVIAIMVLGTQGFFGLRTRTTSAQGTAGATVSLHYGQVSRRGIATPFELEVHEPGGFTGDVVVTVPTAYLSSLSITGMQPEPSSTTSAGSELVWHFDKPQGDTFALSVDAEVAASASPGFSRGQARVEVGADQAGEVTFRTWIWP